jgi:hypothetical protein
MIAQTEVNDSTLLHLTKRPNCFGIKRTGVTVADNRLMENIVVATWRKDHHREGLPEKWLARYLKQDIDSEHWKNNLWRLQEWFIVKLVDRDLELFGPHRLEAALPKEQQSERWIVLHERGKFFAGEICGDRVRAGVSVDFGVEE